MNNSAPHVSRRSFFHKFAVGSALAVTTLGQVKDIFAQALHEVREAADASGQDRHRDGGFWAKVRKQFMLEKDFTYMNTGTLGPTPKPVYEAMIEYWRLMAVNPNENSQIFQDRVDKIRIKAADFLGVSHDEIAITRNTTEGNTTLCHGLDLKQGDEILISAFEHASNRETWRRQAKRFGLVVQEVQFPIPPQSPDVILKAFEHAVTSRTRVIHVANPLPGTGCFLPVKELAQLARSKNILCFVDGAHSIGMVQFSLKDWGVDGYACNAHKWLTGPAGSGILFIKENIQDRIWPNIGLWRDPPKGARKYEAFGRRPWPVVAALEDTLDFQNALGRHRIEQRTRELGMYLRNKAAQIPGVRVDTPTNPVMSAGISSIGIEKVSGQKLKEYLRQKYDTYVPGGGDRIRFSTHYYNTFEQIDRVLQALKDLATGVA
jgi:selenocysteine lyase/cysteine desulfurase